MRYIDADALLNRMPNDLPYKASVKRIVMQAPTADVVEVVRCKDCKHYGRKYGDTVIGYCCHTKQSGYCDKDHFCSYGERREQ